MSDEMIEAFQDLYRNPLAFNWVRVDVLVKKLAAMERVVEAAKSIDVDCATDDCRQVVITGPSYDRLVAALDAIKPVVVKNSAD